jgi:chemotaxis protein methyltransferase CheR
LFSVCSLVQTKLSSPLRKLEEALAEYYGWAMTPESRANLTTAIVSKAGRLGIGQDEYCEIAATTQSEMLALVEEAAIGETSFFREPDQFEFLREKIAPCLAASREKTETIRIWSAACSTGEEPYSIGMSLQQSAIHTNGNRVEIFATDVRNRALLVASQARYANESLPRLDHETRSAFFLPCTNAQHEASNMQVSVAPEVRRLVTFRRVNLVEQIFWRSLAGRFDLIVCTNILTFLHSVAIRRLVGRLAHSLKPGGYLMVAPGEVESVSHPHLRAVPEGRAFFTRIG